MEQEKSILAQNLTTLRKAKKLTQLELADVLNYSDKSISKWENGDTVPDLDTIISLSNYYEVSLDELCKDIITPDTAETKQAETIKHDKMFTRNKIIITLLSTILVWFIATAIFVGIQLVHSIFYWMAFVWALPLSAIVVLVFCSIWGRKKYIAIAASFLTWTILLALHINFLSEGIHNFWFIYFLGVPMQISIVLWSKLDFKRHS